MTVPLLNFRNATVPNRAFRLTTVWCRAKKPPGPSASSAAPSRKASTILLPFPPPTPSSAQNPSTVSEVPGTNARQRTEEQPGLLKRPASRSETSAAHFGRFNGGGGGGDTSSTVMSPSEDDPTAMRRPPPPQDKRRGQDGSGIPKGCGRTSEAETCQGARAHSMIDTTGSAPTAPNATDAGESTERTARRDPSGDQSRARTSTPGSIEWTTKESPPHAAASASGGDVFPPSDEAFPSSTASRRRLRIGAITAGAGGVIDRKISSMVRSRRCVVRCGALR
mmetsp:Transcript_39578/g.77361  ORF Transcript_39578/g.77361 Transcript_39578/m.77361 type:complete len:280 (+) Transcript_39578:397-1236(+)